MFRLYFKSFSGAQETDPR